MNRALETIGTLRTIRRGNFSDKPIPQEELELIIGATIRTANASGRQSYSIIVVDEAAQRELKWPGSRALLFCVDFSRLKGLADLLNRPLDTAHIQPFLTGAIDTSMAAQDGRNHVFLLFKPSVANNKGALLPCLRWYALRGHVDVYYCWNVSRRRIYY